MQTTSRTRAALASLALALGLAPSGSAAQEQPGAQDEPAAKSPLERARERAGRTTLGGGEVLGPDGKPLVPGVLPEGTGAEARAVWEDVLRATLAPEPVRAFDLSFYLLQRQEGPQVNDVKARIRFLAPRYVRAELQKSGRQHLRGPDGDWLVDGDERVRLVGREGREDVRQIEQVVGIARNFLALTDPAGIRVAALALAEPPASLPPVARPEAAGLRWLSVASPDFKLYAPEESAAGAAPQLYEALLGVDPSSSHIRMAIIRELGGGAPRTPLLVRFDKHERRDGLLVPRWIFLHEMSSQSRVPTWREEPSSELKLMDKGIDLRPGLTPDDFR